MSCCLTLENVQWAWWKKTHFITMVTVSNICRSLSFSFLHEDWKTSLIFVDFYFLCKRKKGKVNDGHNLKSHMAKYLRITGTMTTAGSKKYLDSNEFVRDRISLSIKLDCLCSVSANILMIPLMVLCEKNIGVYSSF